MLALLAHQDLMSRVLQSRRHYSKIISKKVRLQHQHLALNPSRLASLHFGRFKPLQAHQSHRLHLEKLAFCLRAQLMSQSVHRDRSQLCLRSHLSPPSLIHHRQPKKTSLVVPVLLVQEKVVRRLPSLALHLATALPQQSRKKVSLSNAFVIWHLQILRIVLRQQTDHRRQAQNKVPLPPSQVMNSPFHKALLRQAGSGSCSLLSLLRNVKAGLLRMYCGRGTFPRSPPQHLSASAHTALHQPSLCRSRIVMRRGIGRR